MNKQNFAIVISIVLLGFIGSTYGQQLTKDQIITLTNYETKLNECADKLSSVCTKPSRQSMRKEKSYIFLNNNLRNGLNTYNFQTVNSTNATSSGNCTSFNSTSSNNSTQTNCTNSTNTTNNSTKTATNSTSTPTNSTSTPTNSTSTATNSTSTPTNSTKTATNSTNTANNSTISSNSTNTNNTSTNSTSTNNSTSTTPTKNTTNTVPPTTQPSDSDKQGCQTAQEVYLTCLQGGYDLNNFKSSKFYDPTFQGFAKHVAQYSQICEAQALKQSGSLAGQKGLDQFDSCYQGMNNVNIRPDSTQTTITQFTKYSAACKKQFSTCDKTCSDTFSQFESCVLACENTINVTTGLQIKKQLKNHISKCMTDCNQKTSVTKNKSAAPIFKCLATNTELTNGTVSASILALASSVLLAIFLF